MMKELITAFKEQPLEVIGGITVVLIIFAMMYLSIAIFS